MMIALPFSTLGENMYFCIHEPMVRRDMSKVCDE